MARSAGTGVAQGDRTCIVEQGIVSQSAFRSGRPAVQGARAGVVEKVVAFASPRRHARDGTLAVLHQCGRVTSRSPAKRQDWRLGPFLSVSASFCLVRVPPRPAQPSVSIVMAVFQSCLRPSRDQVIHHFRAPRRCVAVRYVARNGGGDANADARRNSPLMSGHSNGNWSWIWPNVGATPIHQGLDSEMFDRTDYPYAS